MMTFADLSEGGGDVSKQYGKLKRTVLFTLGEHEKVILYEYLVSQEMNQNHFSCVIEDTPKESYTFIFNGKRIAPGEEFIFLYLNLHEENGYVVEYELRGKRYVNIKGRVYGPFDIKDFHEGIPVDDEEHAMVFSGDDKGFDFSKFYYYKTEGDKRNYYLYYHGDIIPSEGILFPKKNGAYADCEYLYLRDGKWYARYANGIDKETPIVYPYKIGSRIVKINGRDSRAYEFVHYLQFTESGNYAYMYRENLKYHVNINGESSRGYNSVYFFRLTESGNYAYRYKENEKWYININGKSGRGYNTVLNLYLTESGNCAYIYKEDKKKYVNINGKDSKGYDEVHLLHLAESGNCAYIYEENGKSYVHIHINDTDKISRGYDDVSSLDITENGNYTYSYREQEKWYINIHINGIDKISEGCDEVNYLCLYDNGNYAYVYKENGKKYVNINGEESKSYDYIDNFTLTKDGNYHFYYPNDEGKVTKNENGKETQTEYLAGMFINYPFININVLSTKEIYSTDRKHSLCSPEYENHVLIDGKLCTISHALYAWYDKTKHAFIWNAVEGDELVVYEYQLD
jgi:hypothetical protein